MPALLFILFFFLFCFCLGVITSFFLEKKKEVTTETIFFNSLYGLGGITLLAHTLLLFFPLKFIFSPWLYLFIGVTSLFLYSKMKVHKSPHFMTLFFVYCIFSLYLFSSEIRLSSVGSMGGNGDFFRHEGITTYLYHFSLQENPELNTIYKDIQEFIQDSRYPIGSHIILNLIVRPLQFLYPALLVASFHKIFFSYTLVISILLLRKIYKNTSLIFLAPIFFFSLPLLHSVVGMDFLSQQISIPFVLCIVYFSLIEKKRLSVLFFTLCTGIIYYHSLIVIIPVFLFFVFDCIKEKKYKSLLAFMTLTIGLALFFLPNLQAIQKEPNHGGLSFTFPLTQLLSLEPIFYNPAFDDDFQYHMVRNNSILFYSNSFTFLALLTGFLLLPFISSNTEWKKTYKTLYIVVLLQVLVFFVTRKFLGTYLSYKIFSIGIYVYFFLFAQLLFFYEKLIFTKPQRFIFYFWFGFFAFNNFFVSFFYHNNWLRESNQKVYSSPEFAQATKHFTDNTLLIHRNRIFKSLVSLQSFEKELYSSGFYFYTYEGIYKPEAENKSFCNPTAIDLSQIQTIIAEEKTCIGTQENDYFSYHNDFNGSLTITTVNTQ